MIWITVGAIAVALEGLASARAKLGEVEQAEQLVEEALVIFEQLGDTLAATAAMSRARFWLAQAGRASRESGNSPSENQ